MASKDPQQLPAKDASTFRTVVKCYETKQYKKGIKAADQILKKFPEHGETLAMKGLILNCLEKKAEAFELVRKGLKVHLKSYVCWHVYGLLYRADNNYDEAIKCYKNALRIDKENVQILRDLALLQVQMRDLSGFVETRHTLLQQKPAARGNWISFAVAHHLNGNHEVAVNVIKGYEGSVEVSELTAEAYEHSEMLLYKASLLEEGGKPQAALEQLDASKNQIRDRIGMLETRARLLLKLERFDEAQQQYRSLLKLNTENHKSSGSSSSSCTQSFRSSFPRSDCARRLPLDFKEGTDFEEAAEAYVKRFLDKGVPSLFAHMKPLYRSKEKTAALGVIFQRLLSHLEAHGSLPTSTGAPASTPTESKPSPNGNSATQNSAPASPEADAADGTPQAWTLYYLAQHYDQTGQTARALETIELCIHDYPALMGGYITKAKILKHAGDLQSAAAAADQARSMDTADRYINSQAAKWMFRAGQIEKAEATVLLFTKEGDGTSNLTDMQCMWYEIECGRAHLAKQHYGKALKNFLAVDKHFADFVEDQFDFHGYCTRKMTLRAYIALLRTEDDIYHHPYFFKAASGAIETYLQLDASPSGSNKSSEAEAAKLAAMSADERKRHKAQQRKEAQKKRKEQEAKEKAAADEAAAAASKDKAGKGAGAKKAATPAKEKDPDPDGEQLAATQDPLGEAMKLVQRLRQHSGDRLGTHKLACDVYLRRHRLLLALKAVNNAIALEGTSHPDVHSMVVRTCSAAESPSTTPASPQADGTSKPQQELPEVAEEVVREQITKLLGGTSLQQYHQQWTAEHADRSLRHRASAAEMGALLDPSQSTAAAGLLLESQKDLLEEASVTNSKAAQADCVAVHQLLQSRLHQPAAAQHWWQRCQSVFRWSEYFDGPDRLEDARALANGTAAEDMQKLILEEKQ
ncbi:hypothetical protein WJX74_005116 [Apatococcus lobatus]|uniref:Uncharacterized protein n=1 Tax=Apatococcus lobatus TaxID=904363 RepID=A0AAW1RVL1_9CHLO